MALPRALPARLPRRLRIELARPGLADNGTDVPVQALDEIVETFKDIEDAPIVLGHPAHDRAPRFGSVLSVEKVRVRGGDLYAGDVELHDALADAYDEGHFTKWSIQAKKRPSDGKYQLYHLGFLGGTPAAVKRLKVLDMEGVELADGDDLLTIELADPSSPQPPDPPAPPVATKTKTDTDKGAEVPASTDAVLDDVETAAEKANARQAAAKTAKTVEELEAEIAALKAGQLRAEKREAGLLVDQATEAVKGQPLDVQEAAVELADQLAGLGAAGTIELSDGDDKTVEASPAEGFLRFLRTLKSPVDVGVIDLGDVPSARAADADAPAPPSGRQLARSL